MAEVKEYDVYAVINGEKIELEEMSYNMTRGEPIYSIGSPMPNAYGRRELTGSATFTEEAMRKLRQKRFDIHIEDVKRNITMTIKDVFITQSHWYDNPYKHYVTFIARDLDTEEFKKLEEMTNRELAKRLLTKEY